jgi:hypothetical protein
VHLPFLDLTADTIAERLRVSASVAAGVAVEVHVGDDAHGFRNVSVRLPQARRSAIERRALLRRVRAALEQLHVTMAPNALAPRVDGDLCGQVQVGAVVAGRGDASHLGQAPTTPGKLPVARS